MNISSLYAAQAGQLGNLSFYKTSQNSQKSYSAFSGHDTVSISAEAKSMLLNAQKSSAHSSLFHKEYTGAHFDTPWGNTAALPHGDKMVRLSNGEYTNAWTPVRTESGQEWPSWWRTAKSWDQEEMWDSYCAMVGCSPDQNIFIDKETGLRIENPAEDDSPLQIKLRALHFPFDLRAEGGDGSIAPLFVRDPYWSKHADYFARSLNELGLNPPPENLTQEEQDDLLKKCENLFYGKVREDPKLMSRIKENVPFFYHQLTSTQ